MQDNNPRGTYESHSAINDLLTILKPLPEILVAPGLPYTDDKVEVVHCLRCELDDYSKTPTCHFESGLEWPKKEVILVSKYAMEKVRWMRYLDELHARAVASTQLRMVERILKKIQTMFHDVRCPSAGHDEGGVYHLTWAFDDLPDVTYAIEFEPNGLVSWFFRDRAAGVTAGTEGEGVESLPYSAYAYLERFEVSQ
jgi:hypothetical protein